MTALPENCLAIGRAAADNECSMNHGQYQTVESRPAQGTHRLWLWFMLPARGRFFHGR